MLRNLAIVAPFMFGLVFAQFDFFGNMFGHQQHEQQQQPRPGASQWAAQVESGTCTKRIRQYFTDNCLFTVSCSQYLCPTTLDCVSRPMDCPCPDVQDIKCLVPDGDGDEAAVFCVRGQNACSE